MKNRKQMLLSSTLIGLALASMPVLGQQPSATTVGVNAEPFQWNYLIITVIVPLAIALMKLVVPKVPKTWLPIIAPLLGAAIEILTSGVFGQNAFWAAVSGSAGVGLREIYDQLKKAAAGEGNLEKKP